MQNVTEDVEALVLESIASLLMAAHNAFAWQRRLQGCTAHLSSLFVMWRCAAAAMSEMPEGELSGGFVETLNPSSRHIIAGLLLLDCWGMCR
jgi:hypothetical protein